MKKLKIAQIVLPWLSLPPKKYAGTERVVFWLCHELAKQGHKVTLFSVGETKPPQAVKLEYIFEKPLGLQTNVSQTIANDFKPFLHIAKCFSKAERFDIIHSHAQFLGLPLSAITKTPVLHTFHRSLSEGLTQNEKKLLKQYKHLNFSSISDSQRALGLNFLATVYNGLPLSKFPFVAGTDKKPNEFLLWAGRIVDKKGPLEAILTAKKLGLPLILAGNITEPNFFNHKIKPQIDGQKIKYVGELSQGQLVKYYQKAKCLLCPVKWNEPFGLTAIEAMACGTPVVAFSNGGLKETIANGKTGFLVSQKQGVAGLVEAVKKIDSIKRIACRARVENRFSSQIMAQNYEKIYNKIIAGSAPATS